MAKKKTTDLTKQAQEIVELAQQRGVQTNFFFVSTFQRYQVQMKIMDELEKRINEDGALVTKEYVKGRENVYTNPAITEYNKTASAANNTVVTLIKIIQSFGKEEAQKEEKQASKLETLLKGINETE